MKHTTDDFNRDARVRLLARGAELRERLYRVRRDLRREREPLPRDADDAAIVVENDEVLEAIERAAERELRLIDAALERVDQGLFGVCIRCGGEIDPRRLKAVPHASFCGDCAPDA
jgi:RNA polymerase-binding transcription factor DksA